MGTYRLRVPASRVGYVPKAQGGLPPGPRVLYVLGTRSSLGRTVRTAHRGTPGGALIALLARLLLSTSSRRQRARTSKDTATSEHTAGLCHVA